MYELLGTYLILVLNYSLLSARSFNQQCVTLCQMAECKAVDTMSKRITRARVTLESKNKMSWSHICPMDGTCIIHASSLAWTPKHKYYIYCMIKNFGSKKVWQKGCSKGLTKNIGKYWLALPIANHWLPYDANFWRGKILTNLTNFYQFVNIFPIKIFHW